MVGVSHHSDGIFESPEPGSILDELLIEDSKSGWPIEERVVGEKDDPIGTLTDDCLDLVSTVERRD